MNGVSKDCPIFKYLLLSEEWVKLRTSNLAGTFTRVHPNKSTLNILEKRERGRRAYPGLPKVLKYYLRNEKSYKLVVSYAHS